jgi:hypothetical protein
MIAERKEVFAPDIEFILAIKWPINNNIPVTIKGYPIIVPVKLDAV